MSRFLGVYFTARSATFMRGDTEVMVPLTMVPFLSSTVTVSFWHFIRNLTSFMVAVFLGVQFDVRYSWEGRIGALCL